MIYLLLAMVLPQVFASIGSIVTGFPSMVNKWSAWIQNYLQDNEVILNYVNQFMDTIYTLSLIHISSFPSWISGG